MSGEWRAVPGFDGTYEAAADGRVRRNRGNGRVRELQVAGVDRYGFPRMNIHQNANKKIRKVRVGHMVALAWVPKPSAAHRFSYPLDGDPRNVRAENLAWRDHATGRRAAVRRGLPEPSATGETCLPARLLSILAALPSDGTVERTALASAAGLSKHGIVPYLRHLRHTGAIAVDGNGYVLLPAGRAMIPQLYECVRERRLLHALRLFNADVRSGMRRTVRLRDRYAVLAAGRCECCGRTVADHGIVLHVDHIVPVARGGSNERSNLQALCDTCNAGKSDSLAA